MLKFRFLPISLAFCLAVPVYAQTIFEDNFDDPDVSKGNWEIASGVWEFKDGMLYAPNRPTQFVTIFVAESKWDRDTPDEFDEYTMEFKFMKEGSGDGCRPVWRGIAEKLPRAGERTQIYEWSLGAWGNSRSALRRYDQGGGQTYLADSNNNEDMLPAAVIDIGRWYDAKIVVRNKGNMEGWLDGQKLWEVDDHPWTGGRIGLEVSQMDVFFDDYRVYGPEGASAGKAVKPGSHLVTTWADLKIR